MEYTENGDMYQWVKTLNGPMREEVAARYYLQFGDALRYIHLQDFAHRDFKPHNVLFTDNYQQCKVADFGLSHTLFCAQTGEDMLAESALGTWVYAAPEVNRRWFDLWYISILHRVQMCGQWVQHCA